MIKAKDIQRIIASTNAQDASLKIMQLIEDLLCTTVFTESDDLDQDYDIISDMTPKKTRKVEVAVCSHCGKDKYLHKSIPDDGLCTCAEQPKLVKCSNCDEMVEMISTGEMCPCCFC
jgi:hypothetical protein